MLLASNKCLSHTEGTTTVNIPFFLITLLRTSESHKIFTLMSLCHIAIRVEMYKAQTGLTQYYNCQKLGHIWPNCNQSPRSMWCGGGHLHKESPEKGNTASIPTCCNWKLDGDEPHPSNYPGCSYVKEDIRKRRLQRAPKATTGRVFSSSHTTPGLSFAGVLRSNSSSLSRPQLHSGRKECPTSLERHEQQVPSQSVEGPIAKSSSLNDTFKSAATIFQIMTAQWGRVRRQNNCH
jgi:hypothetical protein